MKNLIIRSLSGIVLVWLVLEGTASENIWYYVLWGTIFTLCMWEFLSLVIRKPLNKKPIWAFLGAAYIGLSALIILSMADRWSYIVMLLTTVWANDVGAYLVGMSIGKHKMAPRISPKKSWEGFFGGVIVATGVGMAWWYWFFGRLSKSWADDNFTLGLLLFGCCGLLIALGAVGGDLIESYFKRTVKIKDSGRIIPGHGGMLDRFDALLLATPIFYVALYVINSLILE